MAAVVTKQTLFWMGVIFPKRFFEISTPDSNFQLIRDCFCCCCSFTDGCLCPRFEVLFERVTNLVNQGFKFDDEQQQKLVKIAKWKLQKYFFCLFTWKTTTLYLRSSSDSISTVRDIGGLMSCVQRVKESIGRDNGDQRVDDSTAHMVN